MINPLTAKSLLPNFSTIEPQHMIITINNILDKYKQTIETILKKNNYFSWDNLCQPLEEINDLLSRNWSLIVHLHAVKNNAELRQIYDNCLLAISDFNTWIEQHTGLYKAYKSLKNSVEFNELNQAKRKSIKNTLRDFKLFGIGLPVEKKNVIAKFLFKLTN